MPRIQAAGDATVGQHLSWGYGDDADLHAAVSEFVGAGLEAGQLVVHVTGSSVSDVADHLRNSGIDSDRALDRGQLRLIDVSGIEADGDGSRSAGLAAQVGPILESRATDGYPALRMSSEVASLVQRESIAQMTAREQLATALTTTQPMIGMCFYDRRRFTGDYYRASMQQHDGVVASFDGLVHLDPSLAVSALSGQGLRVDGEVDAFNCHALHEALGRLDSGPDGEFVLDLSGLTYIDVGGLHTIVETAQRHPQRRLVLLDGPEHLRLLLRASGWDAVANVMVRASGVLP